MNSLLQKTREINKLIQGNKGIKVDFKEVSEIVSSVLVCNAFIVSRKGKVLGFGVNLEIKNPRIREMLENRRFPDAYVRKIMKIDETQGKIKFEDVRTAYR